MSVNNRRGEVRRVRYKSQVRRHRSKSRRRSTRSRDYRRRSRKKGSTGTPEETTRKHTRDMLNSGGGLGQEKPEEAAVETTGEEAEADGGVGLGKEVGQRTSDNQVQETAGEGAEADKGIGLGKEAPK